MSTLTKRHCYDMIKIKKSILRTMIFSRKEHREPDWDSDTYKKARLHYLSQFLFGESMATDYCREMSLFAPSPEARAFLLRQETEEEHHAELLTDVLRGMQQRPAPVVPHLHALHRIMGGVLKEKDWPASLFIQNFIVEGLALTIFKEQRKHGDETIVHLFDLIMRDEEKHVSFGIEEMKKILTDDGGSEEARALIPLQRKALYHAVLIFKDLAREAGDLGMRWNDLAEGVVRDHLKRIQEAGFHLPYLDRLFLQSVIRLFCVI